jgi:hypothetical protein
MNKIGFVFSGVFTVTGIITLLLTSIINSVMPKIGRVAFQIATAGSYSPNDYQINFIFVDIVAIILVGFGFFFGIKFYKKSYEQSSE